MSDDKSGSEAKIRVDVVALAADVKLKIDGYSFDDKKTISEAFERAYEKGGDNFELCDWLQNEANHRDLIRDVRTHTHTFSFRRSRRGKEKVIVKSRVYGDVTSEMDEILERFIEKNILPKRKKKGKAAPSDSSLRKRRQRARKRNA
jgi:hypothetical protein